MESPTSGDENLISSNRLPLEHFPHRYSPDEKKSAETENDSKKEGAVSRIVGAMTYRDDMWRKRLQIEGERTVYEALQEPMPKLLIHALRALGCPFQLSRHISVEECSPSVESAYDPENKQIVINMDATRKGAKKLSKNLTAELIQMFDQCRAQTDFSNIHHLACSQIRAVAQTRCKTRTGAAMETGEFWRNGEHGTCVRVQALSELGILRPQISKIALWEAVDKVFAPCYGDTEPFGRIVREDSEEPKLIYAQRRNYGYY